MLYSWLAGLKTSTYRLVTSVYMHQPGEQVRFCDDFFYTKPLKKGQVKDQQVGPVVTCPHQSP